MPVTPIEFVIKQLQAKKKHFEKMTNYFDFLLRSSEVIDNCAVTVENNKSPFVFSFGANDESEIVRKNLTQFICNTLNDLHQKTLSIGYEIELLTPTEKDNSAHN